MRRTAEAIFDLSRGRQALLSVAQPALGALPAAGAVMPSARVIALGLVAATSGFLAVFSLNDVLDRHSDVEALRAGSASAAEGFDLDVAFTRHPLARGDVSYRVSLAWVGGLAALSAVCAFVLSPVCLMLFAVAVVSEIAYCSLRRATWAKTFVSGVMVGVGGLAGWAAVAPLSAAALPFFAFLALWEIGGRNIPNDLADRAADSAVGLTTVATAFGPRTAANATAAVAAVTLATIPALGGSPLVIAASLGAGVWAMGLPAIALVRAPTSEQAASYFNRASVLPVLMFAVVMISIVM